MANEDVGYECRVLGRSTKQALSSPVTGWRVQSREIDDEEKRWKERRRRRRKKKKTRLGDHIW
jgi:hypothetical protein